MPWLVPLAFWACGCSADLALPTGAQVACRSDSECGDGFVCNPVTQRCVPASRLDLESPSIVGTASLEPTVGTRGTTFTLAFAVSEELFEPPVVSADCGDRLCLFSFDEARSGPTDLVYTYVATGDEAEWSTTVFVDLIDAVGNETRNLNAGSIRFDFTPPVVLTAGPSQPAFRLGQTVLYAVTVSEPLEQTPQITVAGPSTLSFSAQAGTSFVYSAPITASHSDGTYEVAISMVDRAGNHTDEDGVAFSVDSTPPVLQNPLVSTPRGDGFVNLSDYLDTSAPDVLATFSLNETAAHDVVDGYVGTAPMDCTVDGLDVSCELWMDAPAAGSVDVRVVASDTLGNLRDVILGFVTVDLTPPALATSVDPEVATSRSFGGVSYVNAQSITETSVPDIDVVFTVDEALELAALSVVDDGGTAVDCDLLIDAGLTEVTCGYDVTAGAGDGTYEIVSQVRDLAGNSASLALGPVTYDSTLPSATVSLEPSRAGAIDLAVGDRLLYEVLASEPLAATPMPAVTGPTEIPLLLVGGTQYTFSYDVTGYEWDGDYSVTATLEDRAGNQKDLSPEPFAIAGCFMVEDFDDGTLGAFDGIDRTVLPPAPSDNNVGDASVVDTGDDSELQLLRRPTTGGAWEHASHYLSQPLGKDEEFTLELDARLANEDGDGDGRGDQMFVRLIGSTGLEPPGEELYFTANLAVKGDGVATETGTRLHGPYFSDVFFHDSTSPGATTHRISISRIAPRGAQSTSLYGYWEMVIQPLDGSPRRRGVVPNFHEPFFLRKIELFGGNLSNPGSGIAGRGGYFDNLRLCAINRPPCAEPSECDEGWSCEAGVCVQQVNCISSDDCALGQICENLNCVPAPQWVYSDENIVNSEFCEGDPPTGWASTGDPVAAYHALAPCFLHIGFENGGKANGTTISQTVTVPVDALEIAWRVTTYFGSYNARVTLWVDGTPLVTDFDPPETDDTAIVSADVSAYRGSTVTIALERQATTTYATLGIDWVRWRVPVGP